MASMVGEQSVDPYFQPLYRASDHSSADPIQRSLAAAQKPVPVGPYFQPLYRASDQRATAPVQRALAPVGAGQSVGEDVLLPGAGGGSQLPETLLASMEAAFDRDFSAVRVHQTPRASAIDAVAYTRGTDIYFAPGQYRPDSRRGQELLGHELTHVVQQSQGRVATTAQARGVNINDDAALERQADIMGVAAARGLQQGGAMRSVHASPVASRPRERAVQKTGTTRSATIQRQRNNNTAQSYPHATSIWQTAYQQALAEKGSKAKRANRFNEVIKDKIGIKQGEGGKANCIATVKTMLLMGEGIIPGYDKRKKRNRMSKLLPEIHPYLKKMSKKDRLKEYGGRSIGPTYVQNYNRMKTSDISPHLEKTYEADNAQVIDEAKQQGITGRYTFRGLASKKDAIAKMQQGKLVMAYDVPPLRKDHVVAYFWNPFNGRFYAQDPFDRTPKYISTGDIPSGRFEILDKY